MAVQAHLLPDFNLADKDSVCVERHGSHNVGRIADVHTAILIPNTTSVALIIPLVACTCKACSTACLYILHEKLLCARGSLFWQVRAGQQ